jgi:hypothetical protein
MIDMTSKTICSSQSGPQDPRLIKPGYPNSPSRPRGRRETTVERQQVRSAFCLRTSSLKPVASSLLKKGQESEPTIFSTQLLSCGDHERCTPQKSKEDSENAVGIAPMALPLDLAMEVWDSWPKAVELTGKSLALPCQNTVLRSSARRSGIVVFGLSGSPSNKLALIK